MSSDDDEELAAMRAQRAAKLGNAGLTRTGLRRQAAEAYDAQQDSDRHVGNDNDDGDDSDDNDDGPMVLVDDVEATRMEDGLRGHFPMTFGEQEQMVANPLHAHMKTARLDVKKAGRGQSNGEFAGPPRPGPSGQDDDDFVGPPRAGPSGQGDDRVGPPRPGGPSGQDGGDFVGPPRPHVAGTSSGDEAGEQLVGPPRPGSSGAGSVEEEDEDEEDPYHLPVTNEVALKGHSRVVAALDVEYSGSRVLSGGLDYMVRIYDFNGMKRDMKSFRELEPSEGHPINALSWSPSGDAFLVVSGSAQPKLYDRDGHQRGEFIRGDMYIRDMKNTKGHVSGCLGGQWHPTERNTVMTCSEDGTVRIWDAAEITQKTVVKPKLLKPGRIGVTSCCYGLDGQLIAAGLMDGTLQIWDVKGKFGQSAAIGAVLPPRPQLVDQQKWSYVSGAKQVLHKAHEPQSEITGLAVSQDGHTLLSRGGDDTFKVWDLRNFKSALKVFDQLPNGFSNTSCCFSPDSTLALTGTSADRSGAGGALMFFDVKKLEMVRRLGMSSSVVAVKWHARINQIFATTGDRKSGSTHIFYDPGLSERGALQCVSRRPRAQDPFDFQAPLVIHNPHALPLFRENWTRKRKHEDTGAIKVKKPDPGNAAKGPGKGGKIGVTGGTLLTQYLLKTQGQMHNPAEEDIRTAILRHSDKGGGAYAPFTEAYKKTQPNPIFAESDDEDEEDK